MEENKMRIPEGWGKIELGKLIIERPKSKLKVSDATGFGNYPFFTSGEAILLHHKKQLDGENIFLATGGVANVKYYDGEVSYSTDTYAVTSDTANLQYLYYFILDKLYYIDSNYFLGSGLKHLQKKDFKSHLLVIPKSLTEQKKIAEILSTVDKAIEQTEQLIAKYQRIKTGLMQDLLTKGIDENGNIRSEETHEFKDSPLGRIPLEWEVVELGKGIKKIDAGKSLQCPNKPAGHNQWGIIKVSAINNKGFKEVENKVLMNEILVNKEYRINHNDFLISRANTQNLVGDVCIVNRPSKNLLLSDKSLRLKLKSKIFNKEFIFYSLLKPSSRIQIETNATGSSASMKNISQESIFKLLIAIPYDIFEQETIVHKIESNIKVVNSLNIEFKKLQRIKTALMQDLLSGQKRVTHLLKEEAL